MRCSKCGNVWQAHPVTVPTAGKTRAGDSTLHHHRQPPSRRTRRRRRGPLRRSTQDCAGLPASRRSRPRRRSRRRRRRVPLGPHGDDLAAQLARLNAAAMADTPPAAPPETARRDLRAAFRKRPAAPAAPPPDAGMSDASMPDASFGSDAFGDGMADASMGDAAWAMQAWTPTSASTRPWRRRPFPTSSRWGRGAFRPSSHRLAACLGLSSPRVIGTLALAPSAVMSVLPGAARLYALFGEPVGAHGLGFEGVRYGWTSERRPDRARSAGRRGQSHRRTGRRADRGDRARGRERQGNLRMGPPRSAR